MKKFITSRYEIRTEKIKNQKGARFVLLTDLHGITFGEGNCHLIQKIQELNPDAVLIAGDLVVRSAPETLKTAEMLLKQIVNQCKVYYSLGNHECRMKTNEATSGEYQRYETELEKAGVCILHNERDEFTIGEDKFTIFGLEIPMIYYHKPNSPKLPLEEVNALIGNVEQDTVNILLAHNPKYGKTYFRWGADLILSGHYHGGILRFSRRVGLTSPQFLVFPPFCCGDFHRGSSHMIVSAGLGEHTIPVRLHNPRELLVIDVKPLEME